MKTMMTMMVPPLLLALLTTVVPGTLEAQASAQPRSITPVAVPGSDGFLLAGTHYAPDVGEAPGVLLLLPCGDHFDRWDYAGLATDLARAGFHVLTYDTRGTGDSTAEGDSRSEALDRIVDDVAAAFAHFASLPTVTGVSAIVGASCAGALAADLAATTTEVCALVLLSGGVNDRATLAYLEASDVAILAAGSEDDVLRYRDQDRNEWVETTAAEWLARLVEGSGSSASRMIGYPSSGHAIQLLENEWRLGHEITGWLRRVLIPSDDGQS